MVRQAKAAAARQGKTLGAFVAEALTDAVAAQHDGAQDNSGTLDREIAWYESNERRLRPKHGGEYLAIVDERVLDHDKDFTRLATRVFAKLGPRPVYMPRCGEPEPPARLRSPRAAPPR